MAYPADVFGPIAGRGPASTAGVTSTVVPKTHEDTYTLTADWRVNERLLVYVAHRKGYKGGGINANTPTDNPMRVFGPETIKDVELGLKGDWAFGGVRGRTNVAAYRDWYKNVQRSTLIPGVAQVITSNLADAKIEGLELDSTIYFGEWLRLSGNFAYTDAKYTRWVENKFCSGAYQIPQCGALFGTPAFATTPVVVDHANGLVTIGGASTINFEPDVLNDVSKYKWAVQPTILLESWLGEDVSFGANIYHVGRLSATSTNSSNLAGVPVVFQQTLLGQVSEPYFHKAYTLIDLRFDWRNIRSSRVR